MDRARSIVRVMCFLSVQRVLSALLGFVLLGSWPLREGG